MKRITTNNTFEQLSFPVSSANISATITGLASVVAIDKNNSFAKHLSFILDKAQKLFSTPTTNKLSGGFASFPFSLHISRSQNFKGNSITIFIHDCFTDAVVSISDEPSLSTTNATKMSLSTSSACSLKATLQIFVSSLDVSKFSTVKKSIIGCDCWIVDASINSNDILNFELFWTDDINNDVDKHSALFSSQSGRSRFLKSILREEGRYFYPIFFSAIDCADANNLRIWKQTKSVVIEPDATILFFSGFNLEFESLEHIASLVSNSSHKTAIQVRIIGSDFLVSELVQSSFIKSLVGYARFNSVLTGLITQPDCANKVSIANDFSSDCYLHNNPLKHNLFKYVVFLSSNENKKNKACNLQHQLSSCLVSKISQENLDWCSQGFSRENNSRSLLSKRVGANQFFSPTRPYSHLYLGKSNIQPDVYCESAEGNNSSEGCQTSQICQEILESELLCWNSRNSHRTDYSEVCDSSHN